MSCCDRCENLENIEKRLINVINDAPLTIPLKDYYIYDIVWLINTLYETAKLDQKWVIHENPTLLTLKYDIEHNPNLTELRINDPKA